MQLDKQKAISELGIPQELYDELLADFIQQSEESVEKLDELKETDNLEEIAKTAHFIKGSAGNLRIEEIYILAKEVEFLAKDKKDKVVIPGSVAKLKSAFRELKNII